MKKIKYSLIAVLVGFVLCDHYAINKLSRRIDNVVDTLNNNAMFVYALETRVQTLEGEQERFWKGMRAQTQLDITIDGRLRELEDAGLDIIKVVDIHTDILKSITAPKQERVLPFIDPGVWWTNQLTNVQPFVLTNFGNLLYTNDIIEP